MKKYAIETTVGIFVVIGLLCIAYMAVRLGHLSLGEDTYSLYARFSSVSGLRNGSTVDMFGIKIGWVDRIILDQKNDQASVRLAIRKDVKVFGDAIASIKTEGLIGDRYVSLDPGGADNQLKPGDTIIETQSPVDVMDLIGKYAFGSVQGGDEEKTSTENKK